MGRCLDMKDDQTKYEIRRALPKDANALFTFGQLLLSESQFLLRSPGERAGSPAEMKLVIERFLVRPNHLLLSAFFATNVVGEAIVTGGDFQRNRLSGTIGIGILEAHSRRGLGRKFLREIDAYAKVHGLHRLELTVMEANAPARALYESMGYVVEGIKRDSLYVGNNFVNEIIMAKLQNN
jgi:RimJ/RimL family protein N-acetyltransferase